MKTTRAPVPYYAMHLALVDQLDAVNEEASLCGWVRAGGLWGLLVSTRVATSVVPAASICRMRYSRAFCLPRQTVCR
jgi:hypothetical protein